MVNPEAHVLESRTRDRVLRVVSQEGPVSITALVDRLGLTETAVRRQVDALHAEGLVESREATGPRRRGRPAKSWVLTERGHRALVSDYDHLAGDALRFLSDTVGTDAVHQFAEHRVASLEQRYADRIDAAGDDTAARAAALVDALNADGYAASARPVGAAGAGQLTGIQLCQGHCPVQHVADRVPPVLRGRDRGVLAPARRPRPAPGHPGPRRPRLHHLRPHTDHREALVMTSSIEELNPGLKDLGTYAFGWADSDTAGETARRGLNDEVVSDISARKSEPQWMLDLRLKSLRLFGKKPMPTWGSDLSGIDFQNIKYFVKSTEKQATSWEDLPEDIKNTYDRLGIPEAEKQRLVAGVAAQYESEVVYHQIREDLEEKGVIFVDTDTGLREHEDLFREYFTSVIPAGDNKFASLNTAVWSGGSFIYVPPGVHVDIPLQAYFRINTENMGQFERTLIIADEGSYVHYVEGCTAPIYKSDSLHSAVVEIIVKKNARVRYTTIQNWSNNVYNLVTKRATCAEGATMEWIDGNIGSKVTMKYPAVFLLGEHARGETLSIAFAGEGQHQDAGSKMVHAAPNTSSQIISKSVARGGGRTSYRGLVQIMEGAHGSKSSVVCDALLVDTISRSDTYPYVDIREDDVQMGHEATVSKVSEDQMFYLMSRGMTEEEAMAMIVRGFVEPIAKELPMEYALELNRLIELQMEGAVG